MEITLADSFMMQLAQQAGLYDLSDMPGRAYSARCLADVFVTVCSDVKADCVMEIGAHEASFATAVRKKDAAVKIFAYEGNPHVHRRYQTELAARDIHYVNALVSDACGAGTINILAKIDGKDELRDGKRHSLLTRIDQEEACYQLTVPCLTLDSVFTGDGFAGNTFCLWLDAEGAGGTVLARRGKNPAKDSGNIYGSGIRREMAGTKSGQGYCGIFPEPGVFADSAGFSVSASVQYHFRAQGSVSPCGTHSSEFSVTPHESKNSLVKQS
jgi:FkbM family methyltransferase